MPVRPSHHPHQTLRTLPLLARPILTNRPDYRATNPSARNRSSPVPRSRTGLSRNGSDYGRGTRLGTFLRLSRLMGLGFCWADADVGGWGGLDITPSDDIGARRESVSRRFAPRFAPLFSTGLGCCDRYCCGELKGTVGGRRGGVWEVVMLGYGGWKWSGYC